MRRCRPLRPQYYQIVGELGEVFLISFPPAIQSAFAVLQVLSFKIFAFLPTLPLSCTFEGLRGQLIFVIFLPLLPIIVVVGTTAGFRALPGLARGLAGEKLHGLKGETLLQRTKSALIPSLAFVIVFTFIVFPGVASFGFRALAPWYENDSNPTISRPA